uniref:WAT1-related protein n=1 Tax=Aegilops tauschii subsp. strangulata TaxID=200361 RepID=A0A453PQ73_AEGTS
SAVVKSNRSGSSYHSYIKRVRIGAWRRKALANFQVGKTTMGMGWKAVNDAKPYLAMVLLQVGFAGMYIIAVASLKAGMSHFVLVVYRNLVATAVMTPFALYFE